MTDPLFLSAVAAIREPSLAPGLAPGSGGVGATQGAGAFGHLVTEGLQQVNQQLQASQVDLQGLATGEVTNLHQVMIRLEESRLSFQLMLQVRNRLLESYQELMRMQV